MTFGIIPARYQSSRFPGKPLALIAGIPMIQRVYEQVVSAGLDKVAVATDDDRIAQLVEKIGGTVVMTSSAHQSGTERCNEAATLLGAGEQDIIVNIQGDEPFIRKEEIGLLVRRFTGPGVGIATLVKKVGDAEEIRNPNVVKVVLTKTGRAIYFSRFPIPFVRNDGHPVYYKHIGIYAYRFDTLRQIVGLPESELEETEKLEQLRWIENDFSIYVSHCEYESLSIDTPEDVAKAEEFIIKHKHYGY